MWSHIDPATPRSREAQTSDVRKTSDVLWVCPLCGHRNPVGHRGCMNCDRTFSASELEATELVVRVAVDVWRCPECGHFKNRLSSRRCVRCRREFSAEQLEDVPVRTEASFRTVRKREGAPIVTPDSRRKPTGDGPSTNVDLALQPILAQLDALVGLAPVKEQVRRLTNLTRLQIIRQSRGLAVPSVSHHLIFSGPPGTGKTTVARILAQIYKALGVLPKGHLVEVSRQDLIGEYIGHTEQKTNAKIEAALGGVLFIDEAYSLALKGGFSQDFGGRAVETLLKRMEDDRSRFVVIAAGYQDEMRTFLESNPGLASRFGDEIAFPSYTGSELLEILVRKVRESDYKLSAEAKAKAARLLGRAVTTAGPNFGNARAVRNLFEDAIAAHATRVMEAGAVDNEAISLLDADDFPDSL